MIPGDSRQPSRDGLEVFENDNACLARIPEAILDRGAALLSGVSVEALKLVLDAHATRFIHPDGNAQGVTKIAPNGSTLGGFSRAMLKLHTDRALVDSPPRVLALLVEANPDSGGQVVLADGLRVIGSLLAQGFRESELQDLRIAPFASGMSSVPVFTRMGAKNWTVRYRDDQVAGPVGDAELVEALKSCLDAQKVELSMSVGEGYVIDNHRWLHGRKSFIGDRSASRLLYSSIDGLR